MNEVEPAQGAERKDGKAETEKGTLSQEESQEEESVVFFKQQVDDLEKRVDALISRTVERSCHSD